MSRVYACLHLRLGEEAESLARALRPEAENPPGDKGRARVYASGGELILELESGDAGGMRALINSYLYLIAGALSSIREVGKR